MNEDQIWYKTQMKPKAKGQHSKKKSIKKGVKK
jgi:hypothetical protein